MMSAGAGESSIPKKISDYRLARLSQDLEEVVNKVLPNRAFHLAAHDWGSIQSWESVTDPRFKGRILSYSTLSGPCLDHAAFWMREQFQQNKAKFLKQMSKSWYIAMFQLPLVAPLAWNFFNPQRWARSCSNWKDMMICHSTRILSKMANMVLNLYRANFLPRLAQPRQRFAICPVQAIVLKYDQFVGPDLVDEMSKWVDDFSK